MKTGIIKTLQGFKDIDFSVPEDNEMVAECVENAIVIYRSLSKKKLDYKISLIPYYFATHSQANPPKTAVKMEFFNTTAISVQLFISPSCVDIGYIIQHLDKQEIHELHDVPLEHIQQLLTVISYTKMNLSYPYH